MIPGEPLRVSHQYRTVYVQQYQIDHIEQKSFVVRDVSISCYSCECAYQHHTAAMRKRPLTLMTRMMIMMVNFARVFWCREDSSVRAGVLLSRIILLISSVSLEDSDLRHICTSALTRVHINCQLIILVVEIPGTVYCPISDYFPALRSTELLFLGRTKTTSPHLVPCLLQLITRYRASASASNRWAQRCPAREGMVEAPRIRARGSQRGKWGQCYERTRCSRGRIGAKLQRRWVLSSSLFFTLQTFRVFGWWHL